MRLGVRLAGGRTETGCQVPYCSEPTHMGWRPLTEPVSRQICQAHWNRHKDRSDDFCLFDIFGHKRPERIPTRPVNAELSRPVPVRALPVEPPPAPTPKPAGDKSSGCRACGKTREPGFTYCKACGKKRRTESNRRRQKRHYLKVAKT